MSYLIPICAVYGWNNHINLCNTQQNCNIILHNINKQTLTTSTPNPTCGSDNMTEDYKKEIMQRITKNLLDIQLLRLIDAEPMWGYKIKKTVENDLGIKLRHGALYPMLNDLEKEGFVVSQKQHQQGRARKVYTLTEKGKQYLESYYSVLKDHMKNKTHH